jgi:hypothetical protein
VKRRIAPRDRGGKAVKYMLTLIGPEDGWADISPEDMKAEMDRWDAYGKELAEAGALIAGEALQESATARTVRIGSDDERLVTDGPFAETKEQIGGFYLIRADNADEAVAWARKVPLTAGAIEVRPIMDYTAYGYENPAEVS